MAFVASSLLTISPVTPSDSAFSAGTISDTGLSDVSWHSRLGGGTVWADFRCGCSRSQKRSDKSQSQPLLAIFSYSRTETQNNIAATTCSGECVSCHTLTVVRKPATRRLYGILPMPYLRRPSTNQGPGSPGVAPDRRPAITCGLIVDSARSHQSVSDLNVPLSTVPTLLSIIIFANAE